MSPRYPRVLDAAQLQRRRIAAGMSQNDLAQASGYTSGYVSMMERGLRTAPSAHALARLASALGCSITDLMLLPSGTTS
jgi:transcriptional regulator with XRE-family HTH domain